jgi:hypothetical protein
MQGCGEKRVEAGGKARRINEYGEGTMTDRGVAIVTGGASGIGLATARACSPMAGKS